MIDKYFHNLADLLLLELLLLKVLLEALHVTVIHPLELVLSVRYRIIISQSS